MGGTVPTDVLERVRSEIEDRLAFLSDAVSEAQQLEIALVALGDATAATHSAAGAGEGHRRRKASRRLLGRKGRRRRGTTAGANDQIVLDSLQGLTDPLDIKTVAGKTGLSQQTASYTLKKLTGKGLLTQSSVAGGRGMPKLVFALASNGQVAQAGATTSEAASLQMSETTALAAPKRKARKKARRRSKAPASAPAN
jgi:DNA-binding transcriptional ArsR family regulator